MRLQRGDQRVRELRQPTFGSPVGRIARSAAALDTGADLLRDGVRVRARVMVRVRVRVTVRVRARARVGGGGGIRVRIRLRGRGRASRAHRVEDMRLDARLPRVRG